MKAGVKYISNKAIVERIHADTGLSRAESAMAFRATLRAIHDTLLEGNEVNLHQFGTFHFRFRKGRTIPPRTVGNHQTGATVQPDTWFLKFKVSSGFAACLRTAFMRKSMTRNGDA